jgi:hypothetical protein
VIVVRWRWVVACACLAIGVSSLGGIAVAARPSQATPTPAGDWVHSVCGALVSHVVPNGRTPSPYRCSAKVHLESLNRGAAFGLNTPVALVDWEVSGP